MYARHRNRGVCCNKSHGGSFGEMNNLVRLDNEVPGDGNTWAIILEELSGGFECDEGQDTAEKGVIDS